MPRFCPVCGHEGQKLVEGLCEKCFWEDMLEAFPREFKVDMCSSCFDYLQGKRWIRIKERGSEEKAVEAAKREFERVLQLPHGIVLGGIGGKIEGLTKSSLPKTVRLDVSLLHKVTGSQKDLKSWASIEYRQCNDCYGLSAGKYEAIVQIRAVGRKLDSEDNSAVERALENFFKWTEDRGRSDISEIKENEGGLDLKFTTFNMARMFTKELSDRTGASTSENARIMGIDKTTGQRYRTTISVKIPIIRADDLIESAGQAYRVAGYHRGKVVVEPLSEYGNKKSLPESQLVNSRKIKAEEIRRVRLDSKGSGFGTFFDLDNKKFLELPFELIPKRMEIGNSGILITISGKEKLYEAIERD